MCSSSSTKIPCALACSSMLPIPNYGKSYFWYKKLLNQILKQICSEQYCKWVCFYFYLFLLVFNIILVFFFFFHKKLLCQQIFPCHTLLNENDNYFIYYCLLLWMEICTQETLLFTTTTYIYINERREGKKMLICY